MVPVLAAAAAAAAATPVLVPVLVPGPGPPAVEVAAAAAEAAALPFSAEARHVRAHPPRIVHTRSDRTNRLPVHPKHACSRHVPPPRRAAAPEVGSAALLQRIRERKEAGQTSGGPGDAATRLLQQLCQFFAQRGGRSTSAQLAAHFQGADPMLFKSLLRAAARKEADGWALQPEFLDI
jgi:hypothetical protein